LTSKKRGLAVRGRYDHVVIGSGDHAFVPLAAALRVRGVVVLVVSRADSLHGDLRRTACVCHRLPEPVAG